MASISLKTLVLIQLSSLLFSCCFSAFSTPMNTPGMHSPAYPPVHPPWNSPSSPPVHPPSHSPSPLPVHPPMQSPSSPPVHSPMHSPTSPPAHPPSHSPSSPPVHPPMHSPSSPPAHPPRHSPSSPPVHPPSHSPSSPPVHPPMHSPSSPPVHPPMHSPSSPPVHPPWHSPSSPPVHPPKHAPKSSTERRFLAVKGAVYCISCKYPNGGNRAKLTPIAGAIVRLTCKNTTKKAVMQEAETNKDGYFFLQGPKSVTTHASNKCKIKLVSSPNAKCSMPTDINGGLHGASLKPDKPIIINDVSYFLYNVGPLAFSPKCH